VSDVRDDVYVADAEHCLDVWRTKPFPESTVRSISHQVLHGLAFMHDHGELMLTGSGRVRSEVIVHCLYFSGQVGQSHKHSVFLTILVFPITVTHVCHK